MAAHVEGVPLSQRFWIIPGKEAPRWIVPKIASYGLPVINQWQPYDLRSRIKWAVVKLAYRVGLLGSLPGVTALGIKYDAASDGSHIGFPDVRQPVPVTYIGTPGTSQKIVSTLVDVDKNVALCVSKIGLYAAASKKMENEHGVLSVLENTRPGMAPKPFYSSRSFSLTSQSVIEGRPVGLALSKGHLEWLLCLRNNERVTSLKQHCNQLTQKLAVSKQISDEHHALITGLLDEISDTMPLPSTWQHGDFCPWNLKKNAQNKIIAVDWEDAIEDGLPGQDLCHYFFMQSCLFGKPINFPDCLFTDRLVLKYLALMNIPVAVFRKLVLYYLASSLVRCCEEDNSPLISNVLSAITAARDS